MALDALALEEGSDALERWQAAGVYLIHHYAYDREMPLGFGFYEDLQTYSAGLDIAPGVPTLVFHGKHDESVDYDLSVQYATTHEEVSLYLFADGIHQLLEQLPVMWAAMTHFFSLKLA